MGRVDSVGDRSRGWARGGRLGRVDGIIGIIGIIGVIGPLGGQRVGDYTGLLV